jgi:hypothetical protein
MTPPEPFRTVITIRLLSDRHCKALNVTCLVHRCLRLFPKKKPCLMQALPQADSLGVIIHRYFPCKTCKRNEKTTPAVMITPRMSEQLMI